MRPKQYPNAVGDLNSATGLKPNKIAQPSTCKSTQTVLNMPSPEFVDTFNVCACVNAVCEHFSPLNAAELVGTSRIGAQRVLSVVDAGFAGRTRVERAEQVAALFHLARVGIALRVLSAHDRNEAAGAADGVAQRRSVNTVGVDVVVAR